MHCKAKLEKPNFTLLVTIEKGVKPSRDISSFRRKEGEMQRELIFSQLLVERHKDLSEAFSFARWGGTLLQTSGLPLQFSHLFNICRLMAEVALWC